MSRWSFAICAAAVAVPLAAQSAESMIEVSSLPAIERPAGAPATVADAVALVRSRHAASTARVRPLVVTVDDDESSFIIPIAGSIAGGNGTFFKSDMAIINHRDVAQRVGVGWLAANVNNTTAPVQYISIPAQTGVAYDDFVANQLGKSGLGAILFVGVTDTGALDQNAQIDGFSRIWTPQPGAVGTVSQTFDAITPTDALGSLTGYVIGLKQSTDFRTNVGIVNFDGTAHTWTVTSRFTGVSSTVNVPPYSVVQASVAAGSGSALGNLSLNINCTNPNSNWWTAYGTTVDNRTGDGWVSRAKLSL
jgi:hypothetical protein